MSAPLGCPPRTGQCNQGRTCANRSGDRAHRRAATRGLLESAAILTAIGAIIALLLTFAPLARAATVGLHLATAHFNAPADAQLKAATPGLYVRADHGAWDGLTAGIYRNSYSHTSTYIAWTWQTADQRFAITAGAVTGYAAARVMPLLVPSARIPITEALAARLSFIPKPAKNGHAAGLHLSLEAAF